jgi:MFS family permease
LLGYALGALTKPLFAIASSTGVVLLARVMDRVGKGIRGTPRDALVADSVPAHLRGAAFGLRQSLDTVGAFAGPLLAMGLLLLGHELRTIFWLATIPGALAVLVLWLGVDEPPRAHAAVRENPLRLRQLKRLGGPYLRVVGMFAVLTLARMGEAFLVMRATFAGLDDALLPLVLVVMNAVYAGFAYPVGKLADRLGPMPVLVIGVLFLIGAHLTLAGSERWPGVLCGVALFGAHMGMTQGVLGAMVANTAPADLRGTAFGFFNLGGGLALLGGGVLAGALWDRWGAPATFYTGSALALLALLSLITLRERDLRSVL